VTFVLTRLSPWGRTGTIRLSWRSRSLASRLSGPDEPPPRDRLRKRLTLGGNDTCPSAHAAPLANGAARDLFAAPSGTMRSHQQKTSFHTLVTRLRPEIKSGFAGAFCSAKGAVSPPRPTSCQAPHGATVNDRASGRDAAPKASLIDHARLNGNHFLGCHAPGLVFKVRELPTIGLHHGLRGRLELGPFPAAAAVKRTSAILRRDFPARFLAWQRYVSKSADCFD
jgi:hypothetical protein